MKKIVALFVVFILIATPHAYAASTAQDISYEGIISSMHNFNESELRNIIKAARNELDKYSPELADGDILYEDQYVKLTFLSIELNTYGELLINVIMENKSDEKLRVEMDEVTCNGWSVLYYMNEGRVSCPPASKKRGSMELGKFTELSGVTSLEEIEEFRFKLEVVESDSWKTINRSNGYIYLY